MATKERNQNVVIGDTVVLRQYFYNSNNLADIYNIDNINIYYLDPDAKTCSNFDGRVLIETIAGTDVIHSGTGEYYYDLYLSPALYTNTGIYTDSWNVFVEESDSTTSNFENLWKIYPNLWYSSPIPIVYDFNFYFQPNKIRYGSKLFLTIDVIANVPRATDLQAYYLGLAQAGQLYVYIEHSNCNPCLPCNEDLMVVDGELTPFTDLNRAFYQISTGEDSDFSCGLYNVFFKLEYGGNIYISPKSQLLIY